MRWSDGKATYTANAAHAAVSDGKLFLDGRDGRNATLRTTDGTVIIGRRINYDFARRTFTVEAQVEYVPAVTPR